MPTSSLPLTHSLSVRLDACATHRSRTFWERYLKGVVPFRGVPMAGIRESVHGWWHEDGPASLPRRAQKALVLSLFAGRFAEDKLAASLILQEILLDQLTLADVRALGQVFDRGLVADWNTCDWLCVKVLGRVVARDLPSRASADVITSWRDAHTVWQRRAANVAFVNLAKHGDANFSGFTSLMLETCATTVRSPERFAQTGVGWLLRELAEAERDAVLDFTTAHLALLSREGLRYIIERMSARTQARLLRAHAQRSS